LDWTSGKLEMILMPALASRALFKFEFSFS